jgi:hypothetical protein
VKINFFATLPQEFVNAKKAISFFQILLYFRDAGHVQDLIVENAKTQERLVIKGMEIDQPTTKK